MFFRHLFFILFQANFLLGNRFMRRLFASSGISVFNCPDPKRTQIKTCAVESAPNEFANNNLVVAPGQVFYCQIKVGCKLVANEEECVANADDIEAKSESGAVIFDPRPPLQEGSLVTRYFQLSNQIGLTGKEDALVRFKGSCGLRPSFELENVFANVQTAGVATVDSRLDCGGHYKYLSFGSTVRCRIVCKGYEGSPETRGSSDKIKDITCNQAQFLLRLQDLRTEKVLQKDDRKLGLLSGMPRQSKKEILFNVQGGLRPGSKFTVLVYLRGLSIKGDRDALIVGSGKDGIVFENEGSVADGGVQHKLVLVSLGILLVGVVAVLFVGNRI